MNHREIDAWVNQEADERAHAVGTPVLLAHSDWLERIHEPAELHDLAPFTMVVMPQTAASAAATIAGELAIVCMIWPGSIDAALRPITPAT